MPSEEQKKGEGCAEYTNEQVASLGTPPQLVFPTKEDSAGEGTVTYVTVTPLGQRTFHLVVR